MARSQRESDGTRARIVSTCRYKRTSRIIARRRRVSESLESRVEPRPPTNPTTPPSPRQPLRRHRPSPRRARPPTGRFPSPSRLSRRWLSSLDFLAWRLSARDTRRVFANSTRASGRDAHANATIQPGGQLPSVATLIAATNATFAISLPGRAKLSAADATARCGREEACASRRRRRRRRAHEPKGWRRGVCAARGTRA